MEIWMRRIVLVWMLAMATCWGSVCDAASPVLANEGAEAFGAQVGFAIMLDHENSGTVSNVKRMPMMDRDIDGEHLEVYANLHEKNGKKAIGCFFDNADKKICCIMVLHEDTMETFQEVGLPLIAYSLAAIGLTQPEAMQLLEEAKNSEAASVYCAALQKKVFVTKSVDETGTAARFIAAED